MAKMYEWRELTEDGLLKRAKSFGPYYNEDDSLKNGSWPTEEEAVSAYETFMKDNELKYYDLVLVCVYRA